VPQGRPRQPRRQLVAEPVAAAALPWMMTSPRQSISPPAKRGDFASPQAHPRQQGQHRQIAVPGGAVAITGRQQNLHLPGCRQPGRCIFGASRRHSAVRNAVTSPAVNCPRLSIHGRSAAAGHPRGAGGAGCRNGRPPRLWAGETPRRGRANHCKRPVGEDGADRGRLTGNAIFDTAGKGDKRHRHQDRPIPVICAPLSVA
jgi:hypothetical protein